MPANNRNVAIIIATAAMASLLEILDASIVNVAIPSMMGNLGATLDEISWVSTGYMIANSIVLPIAAWLGMRLGRRKYFTTAILLFTAASFLCGIAPNLPFLVVCRILQGIAGGALLPTSQTLIQEQFPPEKAGMAMAIFGMSIMIGPALGPTLGGYLTDHFGWRSIFNVNVPLGLLAALMSWLHVEDADHQKNVSKEDKGGVDWWGLLFLCVGVGCMQYVLERGEADGWWDSKAISACAFFAVTGIATFIYWELKIEHPIMNLRLFKNNVVRSGTALMLMLGVLIYSLTFVVPIFVARVIPQMSATEVGTLFIPGSVLTALFMLPIGKSLSKVDPKYLVFIGILLGEGGIITMSRLTMVSGAQDVNVPLILRGMAAAFLFIPINQMVMGSFRGEELGQVAGMQNFFRQLGGSIGIASLDTLITRFSSQNYNDLLTHVNALNPAGYQEYLKMRALPAARLANEIGLGDSRMVAIKGLYARMYQQVFILSFQQLCYVIMIIVGLAVIPLYFIKPKKFTGGPIVDAH